MKILIASAALIVLTATPLSAKTIYYPREHCAEIISSEYSTGGGDTSFEMFEILCKSKDGQYTAFVASWTSAAGFFKLGRVFHEDVIKLVPHDGNKLKVD